MDKHDFFNYLWELLEENANTIEGAALLKTFVAATEFNIDISVSELCAVAAQVYEATNETIGGIAATKLQHFFPVDKLRADEADGLDGALDMANA